MPTSFINLQIDMLSTPARPELIQDLPRMVTNTKPSAASTLGSGLSAIAAFNASTVSGHSLQRRGIAAKATPSYSQGKAKESYRRDHAELGKRGTRKVKRPAPTYAAAKENEKAAIEQRAQAWKRIGTHYGEIGETELAKDIDAFVAGHFPAGKVRAETARDSGRGGRGR